jgi:hypothetical protein
VDEFMGDWGHDSAYYLSLEREFSGGRWVGDFLWSDGGDSVDDVFRYRWAGSLGYESKVHQWNFLFNVLGGEGFDGRGGFGFYVMPSRFIVEDEVELVFRYAMAKASGTFLRENSRNAGNVATAGIFGELDRNHSLYAGINYHFCKDRAKLMLALEYEEFEGPNTDVQGVTLWGALRIWF